MKAVMMAERMKLACKGIVFSALLCVVTSLASAAKLKEHYAGSGRAPDSSARVINLEFAKDGSLIMHEHTDLADVTRQGHWSRDGKRVTVYLDAAADGKTVDDPASPMVFEMKHQALVPTWEQAAKLGVFGFPTLRPFGPGDVGNASGVSTCVTGAPGPCAMRETWSSKQPK